MIIWPARLIHKLELEEDQLLPLLMMMVNNPSKRPSLELVLAWMDLMKESEVLLENQLDQRERAKLDFLKSNHKDHQLQAQVAVRNLN